MGFPLAAAIAHKARKGFLTVRKADKLCVDTISEVYRDYQTFSQVFFRRKKKKKVKKIKKEEN